MNLKSVICCCILLAGFTGIASAADIKRYLLDKSCADEHGKKQGFAAKQQCLPMKGLRGKQLRRNAGLIAALIS